MEYQVIPMPSECKSLAEVHEQSLAIAKMASDLVNEPIVQQGYLLSGQVPQIVFVNMNNMAKKRLRPLFPAVNWKDPLFERILAEAKLIAAQCIHLKYECRERRQPYNHLDDCTARIQKMVRDMFIKYSEAIKKLTVEGTDEHL